ncbi:MAG: hypothetical protein WHX52_11610 [Anaerolineae bacterium]
MSKKLVMAIIVAGALILYIWGMVIIGSASLKATDEAPEINKLWVDIVAAVTTVLSMNAGAYLGLPDQIRNFKLDLKDPETVRGLATVIYAIAIFIAFIIAASAKYPHASLTDMGASLVGFIAGLLSVFLGKD